MSMIQALVQISLGLMEVLLGLLGCSGDLASRLSNGLYRASYCLLWGHVN